MKRLLMVLYNLVTIPLFYLGAMIGSFFHPKIRKGVQGRKNDLKKIRQSLAAVSHQQPRLWVHVSSYGEFLQVKPVLNYLKKLQPQIFCIVSFFSPSGYENIPQQPPVDLKCYLPFDTYFQAKKFISIVAPNVAVIVRHDIWPNFVWRLNQQNVPLLLIDASLPPGTSRLWLLLRWLNKHLFSMMEAIFTISDEETAKFRQLVADAEKVTTLGDTKYDQVFERSQNLDRIAELLALPECREQKILVAGSSWQGDERQLIPAFSRLRHKFNDLLLIIAPHEPTPNRIAHIESQLAQQGLASTRLSQLKGAAFRGSCLIIDRIGLLANIYYLATIAFVGGSFHFKIHNVLEPAVYGVPVIFGPRMKNSYEAQQLLRHQAAIMVKSSSQIVDTVTQLLEKPDQAKQYGDRARQMVMQNVGSSAAIARFILKYAM